MAIKQLGVAPTNAPDATTKTYVDGRTPAASESTAGVVELATAAETTTGTDTTRAVHPAGLKVELDKKSNTGHTHAQSDVTNLTTDLSNKAPLANPTFTGTVRLPTTTNGVVTTTGANGSVSATAFPNNTTTFLRGDGTFAAPPASSAPAATDEVAGVVEFADLGEVEAGTSNSVAMTPWGVQTSITARMPGPADDMTPGIVQLATDSEAIAGTNYTKAVTPAALAARVPKITVGTTQPTSPAVGDLWVDTN